MRTKSLFSPYLKFEQLARSPLRAVKVPDVTGDSTRRTHGLTGAALTDLLVLVELHCISPNLFRKSVNLFHQYFKHLRSPIEFHYYCNRKKCKLYLGRSKPDLCPGCHSSLTGKDAVSYFVVVPVVYQLQNLFSGMHTNYLHV